MMIYYFRDMCKLSDALRSKNEENEAYLSEIEVGLLILVENGILLFCMTIFSDYSACKFFSIAVWMISLQTIGQAYDDMQTQNQHLLQQITERDDYNIKVICFNIGCICILFN